MQHFQLMREPKCGNEFYLESKVYDPELLISFKFSDCNMIFCGLNRCSYGSI